MNKNKDLWHFFVMDGEEYLVIGHNPAHGDCVCVRFGAFHSTDQDRLDELVMSGDAQNEPYLIRIIRHAPYDYEGRTWWNQIFIYKFHMPLEQLKGKIADSQYEIYANSGKSVTVPAKLENKEDIIFGPIGRVLEV